jgi:hypothetical protein
MVDDLTVMRVDGHGGCPGKIGRSGNVHWQEVEGGSPLCIGYQNVSLGQL